MPARVPPTDGALVRATGRPGRARSGRARRTDTCATSSVTPFEGAPAWERERERHEGHNPKTVRAEQKSSHPLLHAVKPPPDAHRGGWRLRRPEMLIFFFTTSYYGVRSPTIGSTTQRNLHSSNRELLNTGVYHTVICIVEKTKIH